MSDLAKAVLAYEESNGRLPPAGLVDASSNPSTAADHGSFNAQSGRQLSWIVLTLPFLDQQDVFDAFELKHPVFAQPENAIAKVIGALKCPTDTVGGDFYIDFRAGATVSRGNYVGFISPVHGELQERLPGALGGFEPGTDEGQRLVEISDGASNTFMLSEVRRRPDNDRDPRGAWPLPWIGSSTLATDHHGVPSPFEPPYIADPNYPIDSIQTPNKLVGISDQIRTCPRALEALLDGMPCSRYAGYGSGFAAAAPRSLHEEGVNVALADGRVTFVSNKINHIVYSNLISSNNGMPVTRNSLKSQRRRKSAR